MTWGDHVDIQVGSCIYLSVCLLWSIALHLCKTREISISGLRQNRNFNYDIVITIKNP